MRQSRTVSHAGPRAALSVDGIDATLLAPFRQTAAFWNWLPAFRAVAEWGGVVRAARTLRTSPSAMSRAVRLLETSCGEPLFRREGRGLVLTAAGNELLAATRLAMRSIHDVTTGRGPPEGTVRVATTSRIGAVRLLPALSTMRRLHPQIHPAVTSIEHAEVGASLLAGRIDAALTLGRLDDEALACTALAPADNAVFCGPSHALWRSPRASASRILGYPFAAPDADLAGAPVDGWPTRLTRTVTLHASVIEAGIDACARGELLAVLPVEVVAAVAPSARLRALRAIEIPKTELFLLRRRSVTERRTITDLLVAALVDAA